MKQLQLMLYNFNTSILNEMLVIRAGTHKMLVRIANREDPDQSASFSGSSLFVYTFFTGKLSV